MKTIPVFQLTATELQPGTSLVEASAGTGKTFTIAGLFLRLILEKNLSVREILVVTYTVAATEELRHRIRDTLAKALKAFSTGASADPFLEALVRKHAAQQTDLAARLDCALYGFDEAPIYTIHGFCQRVLQDRAFETGCLFDTELVTDQAPLYRQLVEDYWRRQFYRAGQIPVIVALNHGLSPETLLPLVRDSLSRPLLKLLSPVEGRSTEALANDLESAFRSLQETWRAEKDLIRSHFGSGVKWANKPYKDDEEMAEAFRQIDCCLGAPTFAPSMLEALQLFRRSAIAKGVYKRAKVPAPQHRFFELCDAFCQAEEHYMAGVKLQAIRYAQREQTRRKNELKIQFFDDLLTRVHDALAGEGGAPLAAALRHQYRAALIDEFQDTDPLQYDIFRRAFTGPENHLFLIGDPKQAIYAFRGADIFTYLKASLRADRRFTLQENWRSESGLVRAVNTLFGASAAPFVFEDIRFHPAVARGEADQKPLQVEGRKEPAFQLWFWRRTEKVINKGEADEQLPSVVAAEIVSLLNGKTTLGDRRLLPEDIAVLVPDNYQAPLLQDALKARNIPSVLHTTGSLFDSREVVQVQRVLLAIADPSDESSLLAALATDLLGCTGSQLESVVKQEVEWQPILERFRDYLDLWLRKGFIQMFRSFMQREQIRPRLLALPDGERRLTNLLHLSEVLHRASVEHRLGVSGLLKWIGEQRESKNELNEEHQLRLETDEKAVKLVTIHKSKGLEYSVVFCPFSWKGASIKHGGEEQVIFHEPGDGSLVRDLGTADYETHKQQARVEALAEKVRLLYVALTRARHRCYFVWGAFRDAATSAPAWLLHPPPLDDGPRAVPGSQHDAPAHSLPLLAGDGSRSGADPVAALESYFPTLDDNQLHEDLARLAAGSSDPDGKPAIQICDLPEPTSAAMAASTAPGPALDYRKFTGSISRDWRISSFTSLTAHRGEELPDHDELRPGAGGEIPSSGIFAFPAGAKPGTCLHKILEKLDFTQWSQPATGELVREQLRLHGLADVAFPDVVLEMLGKVMTAPLNEQATELTLSKITTSQRLNELEFDFPLQRISPQMIQAFFQQHKRDTGAPAPPNADRNTGAPGSSRGGGFNGVEAASGEPEAFSFAPVQGMLKGFIDLVFECRGRFHIVDWKSNLLGGRIEDYGQGALAGEIFRRQYYFQYQLYTVALDRYLRLRLPGYQYDKHFGGVYYLFLRGIDPVRPGFGIYHDRPPESFIRDLSRLLTGGDEEGRL